MFTRCASVPARFQTRRMFAGGTPALLYLTPGFGSFIKMHPSRERKVEMRKVEMS